MARVLPFFTEQIMPSYHRHDSERMKEKTDELAAALYLENRSEEQIAQTMRLLNELIDMKVDAAIAAPSGRPLDW